MLQLSENISATRAPEAGRDRRFPRLRQEHVDFTSPVTDRLLSSSSACTCSSAGATWTCASRRTAALSLMPGRSDPEHDLGDRAVNNLTYRSWATGPAGGLNNTLVPNYAYRVAASYVTGAHAFKTGWNNTFGFVQTYNYAYQPISYTFLSGTPTGLTEWAAPYHGADEENHDLGISRRTPGSSGAPTSSGRCGTTGSRPDSPPRLRPGPRTGRTPESQHQLPRERQHQLEGPHVSVWHGVRLRGDGKTAIKLAANKYLLGQTLNGYGARPTPSTRLRRTRPAAGSVRTATSRSTATWRAERPKTSPRAAATTAARS